MAPGTAAGTRRFSTRRHGVNGSDFLFITAATASTTPPPLRATVVPTVRSPQEVSWQSAPASTKAVRRCLRWHQLSRHARCGRSPRDQPGTRVSRAAPYWIRAAS
jgi:hypothetical protein